MAYIWDDGMSYEGSKPNFERDYYKHLHTNNPATGEPWETIIDPDSGEEVAVVGMLDVKKGKLPDMFVASCLETGKFYLYRKKRPDGTNRSNDDPDVDPVLGFWSEIGSASGEEGSLPIFNTVAAMAATTPTGSAVLGYCIEDSKTYLYLASNEADPTTGKWRVFVTGSVNKEMVRCIAVDEIDTSNPPVDYNNGDYLYDCTNDKVYLFTVTWIEENPATGHNEYSFEEVAEVPSGTTPTEVEDITQVSATVDTVDLYYHDTTTDKYYIGIQTWVEDLPATGHNEYSVTDVTDNVTMFECTITESLYEGLSNEVKMRDITWYVD